MAQVINTNALSLMAQNNLNKSQTQLGTAIQRSLLVCVLTAPKTMRQVWQFLTASPLLSAV